MDDHLLFPGLLTTYQYFVVSTIGRYNVMRYHLVRVDELGQCQCLDACHKWINYYRPILELHDCSPFYFMLPHGAIVALGVREYREISVERLFLIRQRIKRNSNTNSKIPTDG